MSDVKTEAEKLVNEVRVLPEFCKVGWYAMERNGRWYSYIHEPALENGEKIWWSERGQRNRNVTYRSEVPTGFPDLWKHTKFQVTAKDLASYTDLTSTAGECEEVEFTEKEVELVMDAARRMGTLPQTETNAEGGQQSKVDARHDLLPPRALKLVAECLAFGNNKYPPFADGTPNWHKIPASDHLNHMLAHANAMQRGDDSEQHEVNMVTRALMFLEIVARDEETAGVYWHPEMVNQTTEVK